MITKKLYRYVEEDGSITITPIRRQKTDKVHQLRLIADENKILVKDGLRVHCIDVFSADGWEEVDANNMQN